jgi:DNA-binding Xre family transcriptional regulator
MGTVRARGEIPAKRAKIASDVGYEGWSRWDGNGGQNAARACHDWTSDVMHYQGIRGGISSWGISRSKLTRLSVLSDWTVRSAWRDPSYAMGVQTLAKIAMALGVSVSDLIEEELQEEGEADTTVGEKRQEQQ